MKLELADIQDVKTEWETEHKIKALVIDGRSPALAALADWKRDAVDEYKKIMKVIKLVAGNKRVIDKNHVRLSREYGVYEMRAHKGAARLFFFYSEGEDEVVVCTNEYWKTSDHKKRQEQAFKKCADYRYLFNAANEKADNGSMGGGGHA